MRNKAAEKQNLTTPNETDKTTKPKKRKSAGRFALIGIGGLIVLSIAGFFVVYLLWQNNPTRVLLENLDNMASQRELKFDITVNNEKPGSDRTTTTISAMYSSGSGLVADTVHKKFTNYGELSIASSWILTPSNNIYANRTSYNLKGDEASMASDLMTSESIKKSNAVFDYGSGKWTKLEKNLLNTTDSLYGIDACFLFPVYATISRSEDFTKLLQSFAHTKDLSVKQDNTTYIVEMKTESHSDVNAAYKNSVLYKNIQNCNQADSGTQQGSFEDILAGTQLRFETEDSGFIKKITATAKNGLTLTVAISVANDVKITIPQITSPEPLKPGETAEQYLQRTNPTGYERLKGAGVLAR